MTLKQASGLCAIVGLTVLLVSGCSNEPRLIPAGGLVTYQEKPLADADVAFVPEAGGPPVLGRTDAQGRFTVNTDGKPGAFVGSYKVAVTAVRQKRAVPEAERASMTSAQIAANHESLIPAKYADMNASGLTAKVGDDPAANEFTFALK